MAEIFRLDKIKGDDTVVDWKTPTVYGRTGYNVTAIDEIADPYDGDASKNITSIPSPFARIDLVKTAFREVVASGNLEGTSIYHKMVSQALDVAEIFFNIDNLKDKFEVLIWDRNKELLDSHANPSKFAKENPFGKTLKVYLESDAAGDDPYNFSKLKRIYLLNYIGSGKAKLKIVGATSPATLFFSSANDWADELNSVTFGENHPFSNTFIPLYRRDFAFQKYMYAFRKFYGEGNFNKDFPEFADYLQEGNENNYDHLTADEKSEIDNLDASNLDSYEKLTVGATGTDILEILDKAFHKKPTIVDWDSDFKIKSTIYSGDKTPLVLPVEAGSIYDNLRYTTAPFGSTRKAPYFDNNPLDCRRLPDVGDPYPYLTISDFLTDTIVRMPYQLNGQSFFNGNYESDDESFLLPLTDRFFKFFTIQELQGKVSGGKKMFEFVEDFNGIKVILRIPIANNNYIEYSRIYVENEQPDLSKNIGALIEKHFGLGIMPFVKFPDSVKAKEYRVALFDKGDYDIQLVSYNGTHENTVIPPVVRRGKQSGLCSIESYRIDENFNRVNIGVGNVSGVLVPLFSDATGSKHFTFAVDFGTTNTHIEYNESAAGSPTTVAKPFDITSNDQQLHRLHKDYRVAGDNDINAAFDHNFIPETISTGDNDYLFPMRTALAEKDRINYTTNPTSLADGNIPFPYEKDTIPTYNTIKTELKWDNIAAVKLYLENIFILLRNKVVVNSGDLIQTQVIWSYPASMSTSRYNDFQTIWEELFEKYFGDVVNVNGSKQVNNLGNMKAISESTAPYFYYSAEHGATTETVTIDVGGGTTDVYVLEKSNPRMLMSFRFASNAVFGDGFGYNSDNNGFVKQYYNDFLNVMKSNNLEELSLALKQVEARKHSPDIIAFLFSLINNKKVNDNDALNFLKKLGQNEKMKYVFILFYGAILYYVAMTMKANNVQRPLKLGFSGNGARTLRILSPKNNTISDFAQLIFNGVYNENNTNQLGIIFGNEPKIATSKGSIKYCLDKNATSQTPKAIKNLKFTVLGNDLNANSLITKTYQEIINDETIKNEIVQAVANYIDFIFVESQKNDNFFVNDLGADENMVSAVKEFCQNKTNLMQSLSASLNKVENKTQPVEETLFFYPLIGVLHDLALKISNNEI